MRGAIPPLPNTPLVCGAKLKHRDSVLCCYTQNGNHCKTGIVSAINEPEGQGGVQSQKQRIRNVCVCVCVCARLKRKG
jgi:hypothetical protein